VESSNKTQKIEPKHNNIINVYLILPSTFAIFRSPRPQVLPRSAPQLGPWSKYPPWHFAAQWVNRGWIRRTRVLETKSNNNTNVQKKSKLNTFDGGRPLHHQCDNSLRHYKLSFREHRCEDYNFISFGTVQIFRTLQAPPPPPPPQLKPNTL
jgi:hypothetical protein